MSNMSELRRYWKEKLHKAVFDAIKAIETAAVADTPVEQLRRTAANRLGCGESYGQFVSQQRAYVRAVNEYTSRLSGLRDALFLDRQARPQDVANLPVDIEMALQPVIDQLTQERIAESADVEKYAKLRAVDVDRVLHCALNILGLRRAIEYVYCELCGNTLSRAEQLVLNS